ncbi:MAG: glycosyltransferase, partial [Sulfuricurvum sp.]|nr:glycosyltransferase [Sulfuricurvum sp.]
MNRSKTVSIGMPVYNGEMFIQEALDSLLSQTFTDFELIISDNGSTDKTEAICHEYAAKDERIRYIRQPENRGAIANFQFVLDEATGKYFMWAAYDDLWAPDFLMDATALLADKSIDFVFPTFELRSIRWSLAKKISPEIFRFIESPDRKKRVLHFMALHYMSHSANIVYSLFRSDFLKTAWRIQNVGHDGALGLVVLSLGRGAMSNSLFSKRYQTVWPGMLPSVVSIAKGWLRGVNIIMKAQKAIETAKLRVLTLFPEFKTEIDYIYGRYHPHTYDRYYRICSIQKLFG